MSRLRVIAAEIAPVVAAWGAAVVIAYQTHWSVRHDWPFLGRTLSSAALPALVVAMAPRRWRSAACRAVTCVVAGLAVLNAAYHRAFDRYLPLELFTGVGDAMRSARYLPELLRASDLIPILVLALVVLLLRTTKLRPASSTSGIAVPRAAILGLCIVGALPALHMAWKDAGRSPDAGLGTFLYAMLGDIRPVMSGWFGSPQPSADEWQQIIAYVNSQATLRHPTTGTGALAGTNLLLISVESLNEWAIDVDVGGRAVAPTLRGLAARGLRFREIYDATGPGRSSDADYLFLASQHHLATRAVALANLRLVPTTIIHALAQQGYAALSADAGPATLWRARTRYQSFGFAQTWFGAPSESERFGYGMLDSVFLERIRPEVHALHAPYVAWVKTVSMHGPHRNPVPGQLPLPHDSLAGTPLGVWLGKLNYTDRALARFLSSLDADGALQNTTIVLYGDHTESTGFSPMAVAHLAQLSGAAPITRMIHSRRVPLLIVPPVGARLRVPAVIDTPGTLIDAGPTLLELLGAPVPASFAGRSLLHDVAERWATSPARWVIGGDVAWMDSSCWDRQRAIGVAESACARIRQAATSQLEFSDYITRFDLSRRVDSQSNAR